MLGGYKDATVAWAMTSQATSAPKIALRNGGARQWPHTNERTCEDLTLPPFPTFTSRKYARATALGANFGLLLF